MNRGIEVSYETFRNRAKDMLRYKETHGEFSLKTQIARMIESSRELETPDYGGTFPKRQNRYEIDFYRRHEGDLLFKSIFLQEQSLNEVNLYHIQPTLKNH